MGEQSIITSGMNELSLDKEVLAKLETYEDFVSAYSTLDEASNATSWYKSDLLLYMFKKLGNASIVSFSADYHLPYTSVVNYIRTARAFAPSRRNKTLSFTHHFQASLADKFDDKIGKFLTDKRFLWLDKAADERIPTRKLESKIKREKLIEKLKEEGKNAIIPCSHCGKRDGQINQFVISCINQRRQPVHIDLHESCYSLILEYIHGNIKEERRNEAT